jgi:pimeloyl-ACP methyl ester carboxylesterase
MTNKKVFVQKIGSGFPILMLHGFPLDYHSLLPLENCFSQQSAWKRIYIDLPGMGQSQSGFQIKSATDVLNALVEFIHQEFGEQPFAIVGYSFGGYLASALTEKFGPQIKSLFLLAPETVAENSDRTLPAKYVYQISDLPQSATKDEITAYKVTATIESTENFNLFKKYILPGLMSNGKNPLLKYLSENPQLPKEPDQYLNKYCLPTTIVVGKNDNMVGYEDSFALYKTLSNAAYISLPMAGHTLHLDQPQLINCLFNTWLTNLEKLISINKKLKF